MMKLVKIWSSFEKDLKYQDDELLDTISYDQIENDNGAKVGGV